MLTPFQAKQRFDQMEDLWFWEDGWLYNVFEDDGSPAAIRCTEQEAREKQGWPEGDTFFTSGEPYDPVTPSSTWVEL